MVTIRDGGPCLNETGVRDIIVVEVLRFMLEDFPSMISSVKDKLTSMVDERLRILQVA